MIPAWIIKIKLAGQEVAPEENIEFSLSEAKKWLDDMTDGETMTITKKMLSEQEFYKL